MDAEAQFRAPEFRTSVERHFGALSGFMRLGGMSGAGVWRLTLASGRTVIAKSSRQGVEAEVYRRHAPRLIGQGVPMPGLEWSIDRDQGGFTWLFLEDIATPLPRERWLADPEMHAILRRLHTLPWSDSFLIDGGYRPGWSEAMTEQALAILPADERPAAGDLLRRMQYAGRQLFQAGGPISGDPNPLNWGMREDGTLVLFDWERFSRGSPALDLAITAPGLGDADTFHQIARQYLSDSGTASDALAREIAIAKVWSVVEFLANIAGTDSSPAHEVSERLLPHLPGWLREMADTVRA